MLKKNLFSWELSNGKLQSHINHTTAAMLVKHLVYARRFIRALLNFNKNILASRC